MSVRRGIWFPCHVLRARHFSQANNFAQPTNLYVSGLSNASSRAHPNRCRRVRFDVDVDGSFHFFVHVFCEDSSCRTIHDSVEFFFFFLRRAAGKRSHTQSATSSSGHKNAPAKTARLTEPNQRTSKRVPPHERAGKCHLHLESPTTPTMTLPQLGQLNRTTGRPTEIATLVGASRGFQHGPWHWPADSRRTG